MKLIQSNITGILAAIVLFLSFSMLHEFDWLIPPSPAATVATTSPVPLPDVIEEHISEDEIDHEDVEPILLPILKKAYKGYMISGDFYVPSVATPPPDMV